jgi:hypothetical protein
MRLILLWGISLPLFWAKEGKVYMQGWIYKSENPTAYYGMLAFLF